MNPDNANRVINGVPFCFQQCVRERRNRIIARIAASVAVIGVLLLAASAFAATLVQGEMTGFEGVYCPTKESAHKLLMALKESEAAANKRYETSACVQAHVMITVGKVVEQAGKYRVIEIYSGMTAYLLTSFPYEEGEGI